MQAFINYGRADDLHDYLMRVQSDGEEKEFVESIRRLGDAISVCDPIGFDSEISKLKYYCDNSKEYESVFSLVKDELKNEFSKTVNKR